MAYKDSDSVFQKVSSLEPIFTLRAQDINAPRLVEQWAREYQLAHKNEGTYEGEQHAVYTEAMICASKMRAWPLRKLPG